MSDTSITESDFIEQAEAILLDNLSNEQFGVSELAAAMNMSRSNLLRKIKKHTQLSVSQFIRQVRLKRALALLKETSLTVSEISFQVGFGSTSYFIKCFREHYGHPPGEVGKHALDEVPAPMESSGKRSWPIVLGAVLVLAVAASVFVLNNRSTTEPALAKSIAVLPFKNESSDSSNLYFVNGLMESALTNLQKIEDLRVISRTSVEQFRNSDKSIPEIAEELNVNYIVEGSGQRVGDQVLLNIQLIEATNDRHLWAEQYSREVVDIFALQNEVAKQIADGIEAVVTPAELAQIEKKPTENLEAYDYYLQALVPYFTRTREGLLEAIPLFNKAIEIDPEFALAHAQVAICYYYLDEYLTEKQYTEDINNYADKALLYDSKLPESLIAKALYYFQTKEYRLALPHLQKALEYNPNSSVVIHMLSNFYGRIIPNTSKYLEYALKGLQLDVATNDSTTRSYTYLHLCNALVQSGFVDEALTYVNKSLDLLPQNYYAPYLKIFILHARDQEIERTRHGLITEWKKDTTRLDILQEIGKLLYYQEDYDSAYYYYQKFATTRDIVGLDIYAYEDLKIGITYEKQGYPEQAARFYESYEAYCEGDDSIYKGVSLAALHMHRNEPDLAMEQLKIFSTQRNIQYWFLLFLDTDPLFRRLASHSEYATTIQKIEKQFWEDHNRLKKSLEEKDLI